MIYRRKRKNSERNLFQGRFLDESHLEKPGIESVSSGREASICNTERSIIIAH
jgi:hypothetical protein